VRSQKATGPKVLKVLNFSGDGQGNTFTCTFTFALTGRVTEAPDPAFVGRSLHDDGDVLGLARRLTSPALTRIGGVGRVAPW
jgi:hypothetical protein